MSNQDKKKDVLCNSKEVCHDLSIHRNTLWVLTKKGEIPFIRIGRTLKFRRSDIDALIEGKSPLIGRKQGRPFKSQTATQAA